jgi:glycerol-3-phosphate dehydrogenase
MQTAEFDLAILGGGVNGTAIARDAAGRGLRVLLIEQNDLGSGTSSASSKLVHGGLRYLRHAAFRLVREALSEREVLLRTAPHIVRPLRFMLPPIGGFAEAAMLRTGLFIYDRLAGRDILPGTRTVDLTHHPVGQPLKRSFRYGFEYSDCAVDDARFVVLMALDASERGADIRTRTTCVRCVSCCRRSAASPKRRCCEPACSSTTGLLRATFCPARAPSISRIIRSASRSSAASATDSSIPTARSTTRGSSC